MKEFYKVLVFKKMEGFDNIFEDRQQPDILKFIVEADDTTIDLDNLQALRHRMEIAKISMRDTGLEHKTLTAQIYYQDLAKVLTDFDGYDVELEEKLYTHQEAQQLVYGKEA